jgi:hypothetical protein
MASVLLLIATVLLRDEAALRDAFAKEIKAKDAAKRVEAVNKLSGAKEEKTIELLVKHLKDSALEVRKSVVETIENSTDGAGKAIKPLGDILVDKKEDLDLRQDIFTCVAAAIGVLVEEDRAGNASELNRRPRVERDRTIGAIVEQ